MKVSLEPQALAAAPRTALSPRPRAKGRGSIRRRRNSRGAVLAAGVAQLAVA